MTPQMRSEGGGSSALERWLGDLAYTDFPEDLLRSGDSAGVRPYASEIEDMLAADGDIAAAAVFCIEEQPVICFLEAEKDPDGTARRIEQIRQKVWNQNLVSVVLVVSDEILAAYAVNHRTAEPDFLQYEQVDRRGLWSAYEVHSGFIKDRLSGWFSPDARVDRRLLANLRDVVGALTRADLDPTEAEALMAQVIFLCYLEQRGVVGEAYRQMHGLCALGAYVTRQDGAGIDAYLRRLGADFNGDFLSSSDGGAPHWSKLTPQAFSAVRLFLDAVDFETGQGSFWRYDFSHIPVELISGIYETLLKERQGKLGAYYTPRHLANLAAEQAFESFASPESCSVYDGACGSGILLTTAYRKMLRSAEVARGDKLRFEERVALMRKNIFGNDLDETACWITAFSLYLSLLEGLDPVDISLLQSDAQQKLPNLIGPDRNIQKGEVYGDFFSPKNPFAGKARFDIFLCNPPWRESDDQEKPSWENWCREQTPPYDIGRRQIAAGFAFLASRSVKADGVIALIMPLNLVVGASAQSHGFRQRWLEDVRIERIINFADVRRLLFAAANHPCAVVRVRPRSHPDAESVIALGEERIEYWAPKTDISLALGRLAIHAVDRKLLTARDVYAKPYLLISSYWGEQRDIDLLRRLQRFGTLEETMKCRPNPWVDGKGFHKPNQSNRSRSLGLLAELRFLPANRMPRDHLMVAADAQLDLVQDHYEVVASPGGKNGRLYGGPRVLFTDGLTDQLGIRAAYSEEEFAFTSSVGAIGADVSDRRLIKFLTAYLRSPLATFLLIMTGYSVIGERPRVAVDDLKAFPFCAPEKHPRPNMAEAILKEVDALFERMASIDDWLRGHEYNVIRGRLDELVYEYFGLTEADRLLIDDCVQAVATSIQPQNYASLSTPLLHRPSPEEVSAYAKVLTSELENLRARAGGSGSLDIDAVVDGPSGFFGAIRVGLSKDGSDHSSARRSKNAFEALLIEIEIAHSRQLSSLGEDDLFKLPNAMVIANDSFYFLKPMRRRFWLARMALADADLIARTVQSAAWTERLVT